MKVEILINKIENCSDRNTALVMIVRDGEGDDMLSNTKVIPTRGRLDPLCSSEIDLDMLMSILTGMRNEILHRRKEMNKNKKESE